MTLVGPQKNQNCRGHRAAGQAVRDGAAFPVSPDASISPKALAMLLDRVLVPVRGEGD